MARMFIWTPQKERAVETDPSRAAHPGAHRYRVGYNPARDRGMGTPSSLQSASNSAQKGAYASLAGRMEAKTRPPGRIAQRLRPIIRRSWPIWSGARQPSGARIAAEECRKVRYFPRAYAREGAAG